MSTVVQATCPGCKNILRIPADWLQQSVKCKHCGIVLQARAPQTRARVAPPPIPTPPAVPATRTPQAMPRPVPVAQPVQLTAPVAPNGLEGSNGSAGQFDALHEPDANGSKRRRRRQRGSNWMPIAMSVLALGVGVTVVAYYWPRISAALYPATVVKDKDADKDKAFTQNDTTKAGKSDGDGGSPSSTRNRLPNSTKDRSKGDGEEGSARPIGPPQGGIAFPRRALVVSVHNYLYANPTQPGLPVPNTARNINRFVDRLGRGMRIPLNQVAHLSDAAGRGQARSPIKPVIEKTITDFLDNSRAQDRIMLFFVGHATEVGDNVYLVPLEGELDNEKSLIPLKWVYDKLAACKARQKVFVVDVCRFSPTNGAERPGAEKMGAKLDAALKSPPAGVQVWSACVADQRSIETDDCPMGVFLDSMYDVLEKVSKGGLQGIQKPDSPFPLEQLVAAVDRTMKKELDPFSLAQTSRLVGNEPAEGAPFDRAEQQPPPPTIASLPAGTGDSRKSKVIIESVLSMISTPPVKPGREDTGIRFDLLPPLSDKALENYADDAADADSKLRKEIALTRARLWAINTYPVPPSISGEVNRFKSELKGTNLSVLQDGYRAPQAEAAFKNQVFEDEKKVAKILGQLQDSHEMLKSDELKEERDKASKRWQANYDFILARLEAQIAFLFEYQSMLGQMRKELPPRNPKVHGGWRLAAQPSLSGDSVGKRMAASSRKLLDKLAKDHAGTPWEVLAKREKLTALGLEWQPAR